MSEDFTATVRASGSSLVVTIPKEVARRMALAPNRKVNVRLIRGVDVRSLRGIWRGYASVENIRRYRNRKDYE